MDWRGIFERAVGDWLRCWWFWLAWTALCVALAVLYDSPAERAVSIVCAVTSWLLFRHGRKLAHHLGLP